MRVTVKGLDGLKKRLQEIQRPEFSARLLDEKFRHLRCPEHGLSPKHKVNAAKTSATVSYCCEKLKGMHLAKLRGSSGSAAQIASGQQPEAPEIPVEPGVSARAGQVPGTEPSSGEGHGEEI